MHNTDIKTNKICFNFKNTTYFTINSCAKKTESTLTVHLSKNSENIRKIPLSHCEQFNRAW